MIDIPAAASNSNSSIIGANSNMSISSSTIIPIRNVNLSVNRSKSSSSSSSDSSSTEGSMALGAENESESETAAAALADDSSSSWSMFSLTENLTNSYVDPSKLISYMCEEREGREVGMHNFRSKQPLKSAQSAPPPAVDFKRKFSMSPTSSPQHQQQTPSPALMRWRSAANRVKHIHDPWHEFQLDAYEAETCVRHRYNAIKKKWLQDECTVKMEREQFANGAMRACYRLKKLSNTVHRDDWVHASNYVAKCYMDASSVGRQRYFDDVKLQMDAKLWAEIYNRHNPPKKIDMFQVSVLEFKNRPGSPLYHLEHYIEGEYIKYNSNSGYVEDSHLRNTPHAFSHFTFECSNHSLIVVDIQGVGDLYTDPQIHTSGGHGDYGDGDLGVKGFALFFSTHVCSEVCKSLGLSAFDLAPSQSKLVQVKRLASVQHQHAMLTQSRGSEEMLAVGSPTNATDYALHHYQQQQRLSGLGFSAPTSARRRLRSETSVSASSDTDYNNNSTSVNDLPHIYESEGYDSSSHSSVYSPTMMPLSSSYSRQFSASIPIPPAGAAAVSAAISIDNSRHSRHYPAQQQSQHTPKQPMSCAQRVIADRSGGGGGGGSSSSRVRCESSCLDSAFSMDEVVNYFHLRDVTCSNRLRSSCVQAEKTFLGCREQAGDEEAEEDEEEEEDDDDDDDDDDDLGFGFHHQQSNEHSGSDGGGQQQRGGGGGARHRRHRRRYDSAEEAAANESILGKVHLELCKYHEMGRFVDQEVDSSELVSGESSVNFDMNAAVFHLRQACQLGVCEAVLNMAKMHLQMPHDLLVNYQVEDTDENRALGFEWMRQAADNGANKTAMLYVANAYETACDGLVSKDWSRAIDYYTRLLEVLEDEQANANDSQSSDDDGYGSSVNNDFVEPVYAIMARLADMNMRGGHGIDKDLAEAASLYSEAADKAMAFGKGRLANKYYELSEQASSLCD